MEIKEFFHKLNQAVHWFLPYGEANEVMAEYQEMQQQAAANGSQLFQPDEKPWQIAKELQNPREYRKWLRIFALLLLFPLGHVLLFVASPFFGLTVANISPIRIFFWLSLALALFWARQCRRQSAAPRRSAKMFVGSAVWLIFGLVIVCPAIYWYFELFTGKYYWLTGRFLVNYLTLCGLIYILVGVYSLVKCRLVDYSWLALYIISITLLLGIMLYLELICGLILTEDSVRFLLEVLHSYLPPLFCGLAVSIRILW